MNIYHKIAKAKDEIKSTSLKKDGRNEFSKYNYFTPEQIEQLVFTACKNSGLVTKFDLKRNEFGEVGYLTIVNIENAESVVYEMATRIPEIKATNTAQQLGGCVTYTERYLKMSAFGIVENSLDFDDKDNSKSEPEVELPWLNEKQYNTALYKIRNNDFGGLTKDEFSKKLFSEFRIKKQWKESLLDELMSEFNSKLS